MIFASMFLKLSSFENSRVALILAITNKGDGKKSYCHIDQFKDAEVGGGGHLQILLHFCTVIYSL